MAPPNVPLDEAGIISTVLEGVLYGFSVLMFIATVWCLTNGRAHSQINYTMVTIACLLLILSTIVSFGCIHIAVDIKRIYTGLVLNRFFPGGPSAWFANGSDESFIFKNSIYSFQTAIGDGVVIYRCYMVWRSWWIIVLPVILWCSVAATAAGTVITLSQPAADSADIFVKRTGQWITAFYATTLTCNLVATAILAYKLWAIERGSHGRVGKSMTWPVLMIIVDAGALYSITLIAALTCFVSKSNAQYIVLDMVTPIISIAFYMVLLRVGISQNTRSFANTGGSSFPAGTNLQARAHDRSMRSRPMHVHIEQLTEVDNFSDKPSEAHEMARV
ncbi:hypothetical protein R3P38DRAFT_2499429 [Favolaschia claudopus]|uniref:Uncharacterized protein n=1 Tax=Favolaschia claudopus TaxID=2862362 RepID=A0AAW0DR45_9AGAR